MRKKYIPRIFYNKLGVQGLQSLTSDVKTDAYISFLKKALGDKKRVLDCACGYGRLLIPLARLGYAMHGIDISEEMVLEARIRSKKEGLKIKIDLGNMRDMPYENESFDAVICMWSSFNELLQPKTQKEALKEMIRVTADKGVVIIDAPYIEQQVFMNAKAYSYKQSAIINNIEHIFYAWTLKTLPALFRKLDIDSYTVEPVMIGDQKRIVAFINVIKKTDCC